MLEAKHSGSEHTNPNPTLLAFKPRQVFLAEQKAKLTTTMQPCSSKTRTPTLNPDQKALLLHSVIRYLEHNSFSRALKRLVSEAQIENDSWKTCSLNLEDMYGNYLETCTRAETNFDTNKEQELPTDSIIKKDGDGHCSAFEPTVGRKKKNDESDSNAAAYQSETDDKFAESAKNSREIIANGLLTDSNIEFKEKKTKKVVNAQALKKPTADTVYELQTDESIKKRKDKKKKKNKSISESLDGNVKQVQLDSLPVVNAEVKFKDKKKKNKPIIDSIGDNVEHFGLGDKKGLITNKLGGNVEPEQSDLLPMPSEDKSKDLASSKGRSNSEVEGKSKGKKKKEKPNINSLIEIIEQCNSAMEDMQDISLKEKKVVSRDKKRKKEGSISETLSGGFAEVPNKDEPMKSGSRKESFHASEDAIEKKKCSKKRKRLASDENEGQLVETLIIEESEHRKTECLEETKSCEQLIKANAITGDNEHAGKESRGENGLVGQFEFQNTSTEQLEAHAYGNLENDGEKSAAQKTRKKQHNGSAEPNTVYAFQRVKVDEVKFADERLQNNSYWAKDGAEVGYGAKAQEILGQVRGRDFRHEKTKKKRGSYRGGQIDLQAHSVKFNYSDDE